MKTKDCQFVAQVKSQNLYFKSPNASIDTLIYGLTSSVVTMAGVLHYSLCSIKNGNCSFFFKEHIFRQNVLYVGKSCHRIHFGCHSRLYLVNDCQPAVKSEVLYYGNFAFLVTSVSK